VLISSDRIHAIRLLSQAEVGLEYRHAKSELLSNPGLPTVPWCRFGKKTGQFDWC